MNREQWLEKAIKKMRPMFWKRCRKNIPNKVKVSMSMPITRSTKKQILGLCLHKKLSAGKYNELFIMATEDRPTEILSTLAHELIHTILPKDNHRGKFPRVAKEFGFLSPWTSTPPGKELRKTFKRLSEELGPFPHRKIILDPKRKKQGTRMIKLLCDSCGFICRAAYSSIIAAGIHNKDNRGEPTCACGIRMEIQD